MVMPLDFLIAENPIADNTGEMGLTMNIDLSSLLSIRLFLSIYEEIWEGNNKLYMGMAMALQIFGVCYNVSTPPFWHYHRMLCK
ncbi:unnamed protein product [Ilex paraguariensis]|uniref:Uncharacterized protein n=1 Tax=Ilex paraguariensis TaxID=185542 RepID=A0ABC8RPX9_9AQUA